MLMVKRRWATGDYYSVIKRNRLLILELLWMDIRDIALMLRKPLTVWFLLYDSQNDRTTEMKGRLLVPRHQGWCAKKKGTGVTLKG